MQHGGAGQFDKLKNLHISTTVWPIATKSGSMTQFGLLDRADHWNFENLIIQDGGGASWKIENWPYQQRFDRLPRNLIIWCSFAFFVHFFQLVGLFIALCHLEWRECFRTVKVALFHLQIENHKLYFCEQAQSKCGSLDYFNHIPGGGDKKVVYLMNSNTLLF